MGLIAGGSFAHGGGGTCGAGVSTIANLTDSQSSGTTAHVGAKWDSDGSVYEREASPTFGASSEDWIGSCGNTQYEGRWLQVSGDAPTTSSGSVNVWHSMATDVMIGYGTPADDFVLSGSFTFELRRASDQVLILTDSFTMYAEEFA